MRHLVYLTAFMPDEGDTGLSTLSQSDAADDTMDFHEDGTFSFNVGSMVREKVERGWRESEARALAERHQRQRLDVALAPATAIAWTQLPSTFVRCTRDEGITVTLADVFASRATDTVEWDADHDPQWREPERVAALIAEVAERY